MHVSKSSIRSHLLSQVTVMSLSIDLNNHFLINNQIDIPLRPVLFLLVLIPQGVKSLPYLKVGLIISRIRSRLGHSIGNVLFGNGYFLRIDVLYDIIQNVFL